MPHDTVCEVPLNGCGLGKQAAKLIAEAKRGPLVELPQDAYKAIRMFEKEEPVQD